MRLPVKKTWYAGHVRRMLPGAKLRAGQDCGEAGSGGPFFLLDEVAAIAQPPCNDDLNHR
jgi:hypothetical protein